MRIRFAIDVRAAIRQGIDPGANAFVLDINPSKLDQDQRDNLADSIVSAGEVSESDLSLTAPSYDAILEALKEKRSR